TLAMGLDEQSEIGYRFTDAGELIFFAAKDIGRVDRTPGNILYRQQLTESEPTAFARTVPQNNRYALGTDDGHAVVVAPRFRVTFPNNVRTITPFVELVSDEPIQVDPQNQP